MPAYKDKDRNTWYVKYSVIDSVTGKRKQALKRGFPTKRDALTFESSQRIARSTVNSMTFEELSDSYFRYRNQRESTKTSQYAILNTHVPFLDKRCDTLTKSDLMEWYLELDSKDLKPSMKNLVLTIVKSIFKYGEDFYDLPNPSKMLKKFKVQKSEFNVWTPEEFDKFIRCVKLVHYRNLFTFLYMTGCRKSEALDLRYDDIEDNRCHIRGTKTATSDRYIILPDALSRILRPIIEECSEDEPYIFGREYRLNKRTVQDVFKRSIASADVPVIRIHDLRHSFASNAIGSGCNIVAVSKYLGHANINITLSVYAHLLEKTESDMIQKMNNLYQNSITAI